MPIEVEGPDGSILEFPDGTSRDVMRAAMQKRYGAPKADFSQVAANSGSSGVPKSLGKSRTYADRMSTFDRFGSGVVAPIADTVVGLSEITGIGSKKWQDETKARIDSVRGTTSGKVGSFVGEVGMLAAPAARIAQAPTFAARLAGNVALGGASGGLRGLREGETRGRNVLIGGAAGGVGMAAGNGLSRLGASAAKAAPTARRQLAIKAQELGIPITPAQVSSSLPVKAMASASKYLPFTGAGKAAERQQGGFNRALSKTFGSDADNLSDDVMQEARKRLSGEYSEIYDGRNIDLTPDGLRKLAGVNNEWARRLVKDEAGVLGRQLDDIIANAENGTFTGDKYQAVRTSLMKSEGQSPLGQSIRELRRALDEIAEESVGGVDAAKLKALRGKWANFRTTENLLKQVAGAGGDVKPSALWPAIRKGSTKEMRELARIGQVVLKDPIPDSGTGQRLLQYSLMGGLGGAPFSGGATLGAAAGQIALGATAGRAANSNLLGGLVAQHAPGITRRLVGQHLPLASLAATPVVVAETRKAKNSRKRP